jgi:hypothetical protein
MLSRQREFGNRMFSHCGRLVGLPIELRKVAGFACGFEGIGMRIAMARGAIRR